MSIIVEILLAGILIMLTIVSVAMITLLFNITFEMLTDINLVKEYVKPYVKKLLGKE